MKFLEMAPNPLIPSAPSQSDALISKPAGFYSFFRGVFPLRQLPALFTTARHGNRSRRRHSAPRRKLHCTPPTQPHTHTQGCFVSGCTVTAQNQHQKASGGHSAVVSASRDLAVGSSCRCGVTRGVKAKNKIAGRRPCVALSRCPGNC